MIPAQRGFAATKAKGEREGAKRAKKAAKKSWAFAAFFALFEPSRLPFSSMALLVLYLISSAPFANAQTPAPPRQRILLDDGWRFQRGDPPGIDETLAYDV